MPLQRTVRPRAVLAPSPLQVAKDLPSDAEICRRAATAEHWRSYKAGLVTLTLTLTLALTLTLTLT